MSYKILENNAVDNTNIEGAAFNKFVAGRKSGIIEFANNCSLSATGNVLIISNGILLIGGVRVRITEPESFTISSAPVIDTRYQVIAQLINTDGENFGFSLFIQDILPLVQNDIVADAGVYQLELGRFTHTTTGEIDDVIRTADILTAGSSGGADFEIGEVTTETLAEGLDAEVDIEKRQVDNKQYIDFNFSIPKGDKGLDGSGSNPNLLINGDFAINQRGESSYTGVVSQYTADRWIKRSSVDTVSTLTKGIRFTHGGSAYCWVNQPLEPTINKHLLGKTLTLSIKVNAVSLSTGASGRITMGNGANAITSGGFDFGGVSFTTAETYSGTVSIPSSLTNAYLNVIIQINNGTSGDYIDIEYTKLEVGSIATQFVPPLTAEELLKCQRYGIPIRLHGGANYATSTTSILCGIPLPSTLRTTPTIIVSTQPTVGGNGSTYTATNTTVNGTYGNEVILEITTSGITANEIYALQGGMAFLDAEIY